MMIMHRNWRSTGDLTLTAGIGNEEEIKSPLNESQQFGKLTSFYTSQITELQSVIALLKRELENNKRENSIKKEIEQDFEDQEEENYPCDEDDEYFEDEIHHVEATTENGEKGERMGKAGKENEEKVEREKKLYALLASITEEHKKIKHLLHQKDQELSSALKITEKCMKEKDSLRKEVADLKSILRENNNGCKYAKKVVLKKKCSNEGNTGLRGKQLVQVANGLDTSVVEKLVNLNDSVICELRGESREILMLELEQQCVKNDKLQNECDYLLGRLSDAKNSNEELIVVLGKVESWGVCQKLLFESNENVIELYDILVALLESELGLLLANLRGSGFGKSKSSSKEEDEAEVKRLLKRAEWNRDTAVGAAIRCLGPDYGDHHNSANINCHSLEKRIRSLIISLKTSSQQIKSSAPSYDFNNCVTSKVEQIKNSPKSQCTRKLDLETAILMQELLACREEKVELRLQLAKMERQRDYLSTILVTNNNGRGHNNEDGGRDRCSSVSAMDRGTFSCDDDDHDVEEPEEELNNNENDNLAEYYSFREKNLSNKMRVAPCP